MTEVQASPRLSNQCSATSYTILVKLQPSMLSVLAADDDREHTTPGYIGEFMASQEALHQALGAW